MNKITLSYRGNSMKPIFQKGDLLISELGPLENLHKGDVIVFRDLKDSKGNSMIVHRITEIKSGYIYTQGDNNRKPDMIPVADTNLMGRVTTYERNGKRHRVRGGIPGLIITRMKYYFRRGAYFCFNRMKWMLSTKIISESLNRFWKYRIQKIKINTKDGPVIKWIYRNRTIAQLFPYKGLQRSSILSYFLIETKNPDFPSNSSSG